MDEPVSESREEPPGAAAVFNLASLLTTGEQKTKESDSTGPDLDLGHGQVHPAAVYHEGCPSAILGAAEISKHQEQHHWGHHDPDMTETAAASGGQPEQQHSIEPKRSKKLAQNQQGTKTYTAHNQNRTITSTQTAQNQHTTQCEPCKILSHGGESGFGISPTLKFLEL